MDPKHATILVVEDEELVRDVMRKTLEGDGYTVLEARDRDEALQVCTTRQQNAETVELMICDVFMPGMGIRGFAQRTAIAQPGMRSLYVSACTIEEFVSQVTYLTGAAFMTKPFNPVELLAGVHSLLGEADSATA